MMKAMVRASFREEIHCEHIFHLGDLVIESKNCCKIGTPKKNQNDKLETKQIRNKWPQIVTDTKTPMNDHTMFNRPMPKKYKTS